jgi:ectoine hydroxylase-related dioxygenase (phytanoyl-CoA dioxygenase family)
MFVLQDLEISHAAYSDWCNLGYWLAPPILSELNIDELRRHADSVMAGQYDLNRSPIVDPWHRRQEQDSIQVVDNPHWCDSAIRDLALALPLGKIAARLLGCSTVRLWACQLLYKPSGGHPSAIVGWHQDMDYWQCAEPPDMLTAWVPLDAVERRNGGIQFIPGSHRYGLLGLASFLDCNLEHQSTRIREIIGGFNIENPHLAAGQISFHHCLTIHSSGPNYADSVRRAISIHLMAGHTKYRPGTGCDHHPNVRLFSGKAGQVFAGRHFPTLYEE